MTTRSTASATDSRASSIRSWTVCEARHAEFPVFGSVCEAHEMLWRIIGSENVMLWMGLYPDELARFVERIHGFTLELARAQIRAGGRAGWTAW